GCPQTNRKTDTGKTLKPWPVLVDHYTPAIRWGLLLQKICTITPRTSIIFLMINQMSYGLIVLVIRA
ncbi:hypothetical protein, partial [Citrobacter freundii]|uniref:hypothetical protein n=1 Tax=Citrobacter freundii TaxID=546 RepID=UPI0029D7948C|nr:hypothetical protein [Citrobacter freundii]